MPDSVCFWFVPVGTARHLAGDLKAGGMLEPLAAALWGEAGVKFKSMGQG